MFGAGMMGGAGSISALSMSEFQSSEPERNQKILQRRDTERRAVGRTLINRNAPLFPRSQPQPNKKVVARPAACDARLAMSPNVFAKPLDPSLPSLLSLRATVIFRPLDVSLGFLFPPQAVRVESNFAG